MKNFKQGIAHTGGAPINGQQLVADDDSAHGALVRFYAAFNGRDMQAMQENWLNTSVASMSNPLGGVKRGWNQQRLPGHLQRPGPGVCGILRLPYL